MVATFLGFTRNSFENPQAATWCFPKAFVKIWAFFAQIGRKRGNSKENNCSTQENHVWYWTTSSLVHSVSCHLLLTWTQHHATLQWVEHRAFLFVTEPTRVRWTHLEVIYFMMWLIKPKKYNNNQYHAYDHLGERSKIQYYWMRNKEQYLLTLSKGHRFWIGPVANVHCTIQVHPCWEMLVD